MSGVRLLRDEGFQKSQSKYAEGDNVYIEQIRDGRRIKSIGTIHKSRWGPTTQCVEYQLLDLETGRLLQNGTWLRQKDLRYVPAGKMVSLSTQNQANVKQNREPASAVNAKETKSETSKIQDSPPSEVEASSSTTPSVSVEAEVPSFISTGAYLKPSSAVVIDSNQPVLPPPQVNLDELELDDHIGASTKRSLVLGHVDATWSEERPLGVNHVQNDNETNDSVAPSRDVLEQTNKKTATNLTVDQVSQWVSARKKRMKTRAAITEDYLTTLAGRDQIFIIDDPETIGPSRAKMKEAFDALAHLAEKEDTDGIQLRFTNTGINEQTAVQDRASPLESADEAGFRGQTLDRSDTRQPPNLEDDLSKAMNLLDPDEHTGNSHLTLLGHTGADFSNAPLPTFSTTTLADTMSESSTHIDEVIHIASFLMAEPELNKLCRLVINKLGRHEFVNTGTRSFEAFHDGLFTEAHKDLQVLCVNFLGTRNVREKICKQMTRIVTLADTKTSQEQSDVLEQGRMRRDRLERFLANMERPLMEDIDDQLANDDSWFEGDDAIDEAEDEIQPPIIPSSRLAEIECFFVGSKHFQVFLNSFREILLSREVREIVVSRPVALHSENNRSAINLFKSAMEDYTGLRWNWWPLEPRMRTLAAKESRLVWHCTCGARLWKEVSQDEAELIRPMLPRHRYNEAMAPRCVVRTNNSSFWTKISQKFSTFTSAIASNSQPTQPTQSTQISNNMPPNPSQQPGGTQARRTRRGATSFSQISSKWILFGVQGSRLSVELEHIEIDEYVNDSSFFRALRQHYRKHRGILKLMFSVWRLGYCDNFKFERLAANFILPHSPDLPMDFNEYKYDPHPPGAKNPLISHHQASMFLNCDRQCHPFWKLLHECVPDLIDTRTIDKIPKKQSRFSLDSTQPQDSAAWGLQAQYEVSAIYVAVYHLVILIPPFVFWGWWQSKHPNDLQNASIPATVAIGLLSIFWGTNGILTHGRQPVGRSL